MFCCERMEETAERGVGRKEKEDGGSVEEYMNCLDWSELVSAPSIAGLDSSARSRCVFWHRVLRHKLLRIRMTLLLPDPP